MSGKRVTSELSLRPFSASFIIHAPFVNQKMSSAISTSVSVPLLPLGPKGNFILGVMRDYQRDQFGFVERCAREYGDIVRMKFLYVQASLSSTPI
jgi:hypothetical protein